MKKILLLIIFIIFSVNSSAISLNPFKKVENNQEESECAEFQVYYKVLLVNTFDNGTRVYFVFAVTENDVFPIAVIDETETKIFNTDKNGKPLDYYNWNNIEEKKQSYIDQNFPGISPLALPRK